MNEFAPVRDCAKQRAYVVAHSHWLRICLSVDGYFFAVAREPITAVHGDDGQLIATNTPIPLTKATELAKTYGLETVDNDPELTDYADTFPDNYFGCRDEFKASLERRHMPPKATQNMSGWEYAEHTRKREAALKRIEAIDAQRDVFAKAFRSDTV